MRGTRHDAKVASLATALVHYDGSFYSAHVCIYMCVTCVRRASGAFWSVVVHVFVVEVHDVVEHAPCLVCRPIGV